MATVLILPVEGQSANDFINFQGKLVNISDGTNLLPGAPSCVAAGADTCDIRASIYSDSVGGTLLWQEPHADVELGDYEGVFSLQLNSVCNSWDSPGGSCSGSGITWGADDTIYLQIEFDDDGNGDFVGAEVFTRKLLNSVPYAYYSDVAGSVSGGLDTVYDNDPDKILNIDDPLGLEFINTTAADLIFDLQSTGDILFQDNNVTFLTISDTGGLDWLGTAGVDVLFAFGDGADLFNITGGNLQVGDGTPDLTLDGEDAYIEGTLEVDGNTDFGSDVDFNNNEAIAFRVENADGSVSVPVCDSSTAGRQYYDVFDDNAYVCIETSPSVYGWFDYTATVTSTSTKVVTVGTGGDYGSISAAAGYLNGLTGGIILLTPETHAVTTTVNLDNISLIGANTGDTVISITGAGVLEVKETQFKSLTLDIDPGITADSGLDALYDASTTSSIIFEWVQFDIGAGKVLLDSTEATAPTVRTRFISTFAAGGTGTIFPAISSSNLDSGSSHFVESQGGTGSLEFVDWDVEIAGSANVTTSGNVSTIPNNTIFVYPGMNLQGAIDSLGSGGVINLLPGTHTITAPVVIGFDNISIDGYGDSTIISASGFSGITAETAAIQIGAADGTAPVDDVILQNFKVEVSGMNTHGVRAAGGTDIQLYNLTVQKIAGAGGTGGTARMGIHFIDGTAEQLVRPVIQNCRVFGNGAGNYFTDGIHVTSDGSISGVFGNGQGVINALIDGNNVDFVGETAAVFVGVDDSSLFNNRFSRMGAGGGGGPYGLYIGNSSRINFNANTVSGSLSTGGTAVGIESFNVGSLSVTEDSVFNANIIDGFANGGVGFANGWQIGNASNTDVHRNIFQNNTITGASNVTTVAIDIRGDADDNTFANNVLSGGTNPWDVGINIASATASNNTSRNNKAVNVTTNFNDGGTATKLGVSHHQATVDPTVSEDGASGYPIGTIWINTSADNAFISLDASAGAAIWEQINGGSGGSGDLDDAYTNDTDKILNINDALGLEFINTTAADIVFDLQSTGDITFQDNNATFLTISDTGGLDLVLDAADNPSFTITNNGTANALDITQTGEGTALEIDATAISTSNGLQVLFDSANLTSGFAFRVTDNTTDRLTLGDNGALSWLGAGGANAVLDTGGSTDLVNITNGNLKVGDGSPSLALNGEDFYVEGTLEADGIGSIAGALTVGTATNTFLFDPATGPLYSGTARPSKTIVLSPEYAGGTLTTFYGAGTETNTLGSMTADIESSAANDQRTFYEWTSSEAGLQGYVVAVRVTLPQDFSAWQTSNALTVNYVTETTVAGNNQMDAYIYRTNDVTTEVASDLNNASASAGVWESFVIDDSVLDDGASTEWDAAGEAVIIYLHMQSLSDNYVRIGDITLNYLARF